MYQITCDGRILYDPRDEALMVLNPRCKLEVNTVGEASFTINHSHPYYGHLKRLKSLFEIRQNGHVIFRGRMTNNSRNFDNQLYVDLEGLLACANDSIIPPFKFPEDFPEAANAENTVEYFLSWLIDTHNEQVTGEWQKLKLGSVTVADPNNYITRSSEKYMSLWGVLKTKLFESELGGKLCVRYEADGLYMDYVSAFELTNPQRIRMGENLLDLTQESNASETYSAILPLGAEIETETTDENGETIKYTLTLENVPDGDLTDDLVKKGKFIYSKSAVEEYGWICVPVEESTWDDVTEVSNLKTKAMVALAGNAVMLSDTITFKAMDLGFTDDEIQSFRIYRNILVDSPAHGLMNTVYPLNMLDIDMFNPQNTVIVAGDTTRTLTSVNDQRESAAVERVETVERDVAENRQQVNQVRNQLITEATSLITSCEAIIAGALKSYVEISDYSTFKEITESQLSLLSNQLTVKFTEAVEEVNRINGDLQEKYNTITKHFTFNVDGLTIGAENNPNTVVVDNDEVTINVNNVPVLRFDAHGKALIPELNITTMLNLFGLQVTEDENNINCDYIEGA